VRRHLLASVLALVVGLVVATGGFAVAAAGDDEAEALGPGPVALRLGIEHSRFSTNRIVVRVGTTLHIDVVNDDPIIHELIVGDAEVHRRHEGGTEAHHPTIPGEVTVGPGERGHTFYTFDRPGEMVFACHLPGHVAYGMTGVVEVIE
jgi:uncharacterized cupredoxin-like copper-binding protein